MTNIEEEILHIQEDITDVNKKIYNNNLHHVLNVYKKDFLDVKSKIYNFFLGTYSFLMPRAISKTHNVILSTINIIDDFEALDDEEDYEYLTKTYEDIEKAILFFVNKINKIKEENAANVLLENKMYRIEEYPASEEDEENEDDVDYEDYYYNTVVKGNNKAPTDNIEIFNWKEIEFEQATIPYFLSYMGKQRNEAESLLLTFYEYMVRYDKKLTNDLKIFNEKNDLFNIKKKEIIEREKDITDWESISNSKIKSDKNLLEEEKKSIEREIKRLGLSLKILKTQLNIYNTQYGFMELHNKNFSLFMINLNNFMK